MATKVLDLNNAELLHSLQLTLQDKDETTLLVTIPTEGLVTELEAQGPQLTKLLAKGDKESVDACFDLAARLISCNRNGKEITGKELREVYNMSFETLIMFYSAYMDFITEINNSKN